MPDSGFGLLFPLLQGGEEPLAGKLAVLGLVARVLDRDRDIGREVAQGDAGGDLVDVLAARAGSPAESFLQFSVNQRNGLLHGKSSLH